MDYFGSGGQAHQLSTPAQGRGKKMTYRGELDEKGDSVYLARYIVVR
jgi:hypothetical protein